MAQNLNRMNHLRCHSVRNCIGIISSMAWNFRIRRTEYQKICSKFSCRGQLARFLFLSV